MKLTRTIRLLLTFYRSFFLLNSLITLACLLLFLEYGWSVFITLCWFKLATLALVFYYIRSYKRKEFHYYQHLGLSKTLLWTSTLLFDFALYLAVLIVGYHLLS